MIIDELTLDTLAYRYKSDKGITPFKDGQYMHGYVAVYQQLFSPRRAEKINIFDVGAWGENKGGSSLMWREYFPNAHIYSLDYYADVKTLEANDRITAFQCNLDNEQETIDKVSALGVSFDIVIEDASHSPKQQMRTLLNLSPFLSPKFTYIIEDIAVNPALVEVFIAGRQLPYMSPFEWLYLQRITKLRNIISTNAHSKLAIIQ